MDRLVEHAKSMGWDVSIKDLTNRKARSSIRGSDHGRGEPSKTSEWVIQQALVKDTLLRPLDLDDSQSEIGSSYSLAGPGPAQEADPRLAALNRVAAIHQVYKPNGEIPVPDEWMHDWVGSQAEQADVRTG